MTGIIVGAGTTIIFLLIVIAIVQYRRRKRRIEREIEIRLYYYTEGYKEEDNEPH